MTKDMRVPIIGARKLGLYSIEAERADNNRLVILRHRFRKDDPALKRTLARIRDAGEIDLRHWREPTEKGW